MTFIKQFGMEPSLDRVLQLVYMSANLFTAFNVEQDHGKLKIDEDRQYSKSERTELLTYFLDLVEYFSHERIHLVQDPKDESTYALA